MPKKINEKQRIEYQKIDPLWGTKIGCLYCFKCSCAACHPNGPCTERRPRNSTTRSQKLKILEEYFLKNIVEDPIDGTNFDCDILNHFKILKNKYKN